MHDDLSNGGLDALIDEAARQLTARPLPGSLRERVAGSLPPRRSARARLGPLAAATASLLVVVAAAVVLRGPLAERNDHTGAARQAAAATDVLLRPAPAPADGPVVAGARGTQRSAAGTAAAVQDPDPLPIVVVPLVLSPLAEADVRTLAVDFLAAPMPLALEPIVIEPLTLE